MPTAQQSADPIGEIRHFNRFYTPLVGALDEGHLGSEFSLAEVRILYEIAHRPAVTATVLVRDLGLDRGYVSRMLRSLHRLQLVSRKRSSSDARESNLGLTAKGRATMAVLEGKARESVAQLIAPLDDGARDQLVASMRVIRGMLGSSSEQGAEPFTLRTHRAGDMGWVVHAHGLLYAREYEWDERFEALVAHIVAGFIDHFDPARERCWIAERHGRSAGSVFLVRHPEREGVAKLRLLLVDPSARGLGIGQRLVRECTVFARSAGYHTITLWTNDVLSSARRIYEGEGYRLVQEEPHNSFGHDLVGQNWELTL